MKLVKLLRLLAFANCFFTAAQNKYVPFAQARNRHQYADNHWNYRRLWLCRWTSLCQHTQIRRWRWKPRTENGSR